MRRGYTIRQVKDICTKGSSQVAQKDLGGFTGDYPIYGASGLIKNVDFYHQEKEYIGLVKDGSGIGRVMFLPPKSSVIGTLQYILPKEGYNIRYIGYCLQSLKLDKYKQGAAIPHIYFRDYGETQILVADNPEEQQRIVALLDSEFAKIDTLKANAERNLQNAKDLYVEVLKQELKPQKEWNSQTLDNVCSKIVDGTHNSPVNLSAGDYMYVTAKNIKTWGLDLSNITYVTSEVHREIYDRCNPEKGDVLYIKDGATTGIAIVNPISEEFSLLSSVALLKPKNNIISGAFLCYAMNSPMMYQFVREQMDGAAITRITLKKIKSFTISYPSLEKQRQVVARLDALSEKCKTLQANYEKTIALCDDLKQALLRKAFNGEL